MKRLLHKLVQGFTTALCTVGGATLRVSAIDGEPYGFGWAAAPAAVRGARVEPVLWAVVAPRKAKKVKVASAAAVAPR